MTNSQQKVSLNGLARKLVRDGLLNEQDALKAMESANTNSKSLPLTLIESGLLSGLEICTAASEEFGTPLLDLSALLTNTLPKGLVDTKLIAKHQALPLFKRGNRLFVAVSDPANLHALDEMKFNTGLTTEAILVEANKLQTSIETYLNASEETLGDALGDLDEDSLEDLDIQAVGDEDRDDDSSEVDEAPIVRFVNKVLLDAIKMGASDIHFEPYEKSYRVRLRVDGILREVAKPPVNLLSLIHI